MRNDLMAKAVELDTAKGEEEIAGYERGLSALNILLSNLRRSRRVFALRDVRQLP